MINKEIEFDYLDEYEDYKCKNKLDLNIDVDVELDLDLELGEGYDVDIDSDDDIFDEIKGFGEDGLDENGLDENGFDRNGFDVNSLNNFDCDDVMLTTSLDDSISKELELEILELKKREYENSKSSFVKLIEQAHPTELINSGNREMVIRETSRYISDRKLFQSLDPNKKETVLLFSKIYRIKTKFGVYF